MTKPKASICFCVIIALVLIGICCVTTVSFSLENGLLNKTEKVLEGIQSDETSKKTNITIEELILVFHPVLVPDDEPGFTPDGWRALYIMLNETEIDGCNSAIVLPLSESSWLTKEVYTSFIAIETANGDILLYTRPLSQDGLLSKLEKRAEELNVELGILTSDDTIVFAFLSDNQERYVNTMRRLLGYR